MKKENGKKGFGNKGFSLVELIIVIAIMAILIGIVGSQAIPYLEKSRESKDLTTLDAVFYAFQSAVLDNEQTAPITADGIANLPVVASPKGGTVKQTVEELLGANMDTDTELESKFKSKKGIATTPGTSASHVLFKFSTSSGVISVQKGTLPAISN